MRAVLAHLGDPGVQGRFALCAAVLQTDFCRALDLAAIVLGGVVEAGHERGVLDRGVFIVGSRGLDRVDPFFVDRFHGRIAPVEGGLDFRQAGIAAGGAGIARGHHEITVAQTAGGNLQIGVRLEGNVLFSVVGRLAVRADIGAVEAPVAGLARPHPVINVAAELADGFGRRVDEAHVANFQTVDQAEFLGAVEPGDLTAMAFLFLAFGDDGLFAVLDLLIAVARIGFRRQAFQHAVRHVLDRGGDIDTAARRGRQLVAHRLGQKAVSEIVVLFRRIELDGAIGAVMVGHGQALRRDEGGGAAAEADHRVHRPFGQVGKLAGGNVQAQRLKLVRELGQLVRAPHAFLGAGRGRPKRNKQCESRTSHLFVSPLYEYGFHRRKRRPA